MAWHPKADPADMESWPNNLDVTSGPATLWSRVNAAEALPGVSTPLSWEFWDRAGERAMRGSMCDIGVLRSDEVDQPDEVDARAWASFRGRVAINLDFYRLIADRSPGTSGEEFERHVLGTVRPGLSARRDLRRYPVIFAKAPRLRRALPGRIEAQFDDTDRWWRRSVRELTDDPVAAVAAWHAARIRHEQVMRVHCAASNLAQHVYGRLATIAADVGAAGAEQKISGGYVDTEDVRVLTMLWDAARGGDLDSFVEAHGYHGPDEGQLASSSWREDRRPLIAIAEAFRSATADHSPVLVATQRQRERHDAERALLAAVPPARRRRAGRTLADLEELIRLRERGKVMSVRTTDVARAASRVVGRHLARTGVIEHEEDVFFLSTDEAFANRRADLRDAVAWRREVVATYEAFELPDWWVGDPQPVAAQRPTEAVTSLTGIGASPGRAEGPVRVVESADASRFEPGDVLVCRTTDPSWSAFMLLASAIVVDIGGPMSHGAIIARELGVPCVMNTKNGTAHLRSGDTVAVDGDRGVVEIVARTN